MFSTKSARPQASAAGKKASFSSSSKHRAGKSATSKSKRSFKDQVTLSDRARRLAIDEQSSIHTSQLGESAARRINIPDENPEIFSSILEFLYKGDYYPRLVHDKKRNSWTLEDPQSEEIRSSTPAVTTIYDHRINQIILKDTVIYCAADKYGLEELKKLALRKQGLQSRIQCSIILASARFAYDNTPESDAKLRAHYLALIIRSRQTFKRSG